MFSERDKKEEELRFLKESFDAGVISSEEYEIAKERLNSKLRELSDIGKKDQEHGVKENQESSSEEKTESENKETEKEILEEMENQEAKEEQKEIKETTEAEKTEEKAEDEKEQEEKPEEIEQVEIKEETKELPAEEAKTDIHEKETKEEQKKLEETTETKKIEEKAEEKKQEPEIWEDKTSNKRIFIYLAIIIIFGLISWYFFFSGNSAPLENVDAPVSLIACSSDSECTEEGKIGLCLKPGLEDAECKFIDDARIKLIILNDETCFNCETNRVLSILKSFFKNLETEKIDFNTQEGIALIKKFKVNTLPAYILNSSFTEAYNFDKFSSSFNEVENSFVMKNTASNANLYIDRDEIPNKINLFFKSGETVNTIAEENLNEFLEAFEGKVDFEKHNADSRIVKELKINTFPTFLINKIGRASCRERV